MVYEIIDIINHNIKGIFSKLDCQEYICLTTFITIIFLFLIIIYKITFHKYNLDILFNKIKKINILQFIYLISIVLCTLLFSHLIYNKNNKIFIGIGFILSGILLIYQNLIIK